jgi:pimeloyl-ACP methyl ester carboxylesterase
METILFLHGWGGNSQSFVLIERYFAKTYNIICPSMPCFQSDDGNGNSKSLSCVIESQSLPEKPWTLDDYVLYIESILREKNVSKCNIIAHSFGARVAVLLINKNPALVNKMVIVGGAGLKPRLNLFIWLKIKFYKIKKRLFRDATGGSSDYKALTPNGKIAFQNIIKRDLSFEIKSVKVPTLLIYGKHDRSTPPYMGRRFAKLCQTAKLKIYKNCGHFAYLEQPSRFITDCKDFFA